MMNSAIGIILILMISCGMVLRISIEEDRKQEEEDFKEFEDWWMHSKFNEFELIKQYTTEFLGALYYREVLKQRASEEYFDVSCTVNDYYKFEEGVMIEYTKSPIEIPIITDATIEAFNKETGKNFNPYICEAAHVRK